MRIEADRARGDGVMTTKRNDDQHKCGDVKESTRPIGANSGDELQSDVPPPDSDTEREEVGGSNRRATEDSEEDSDSSTMGFIASHISDELVSDMQNLHLRTGSADQCIERLVSRGLPNGTDTTGTGCNNDYQCSSVHVVCPTLVESDKTPPSDVRFKRKIIYESPMINLQPQHVTVADTSFGVIQFGSDCEGWTGYGAQQQGQQATKFRRSGSDPQESDERAYENHGGSLTSALISGICGGGSGLGESGALFDFDTESDLGLFLGHDVAPAVLGCQTDALRTEELTPNRGTLLNQLEEIGPPPTNWMAGPNPEIALNHYYENVSHVTSSIPAVTTVVSRDITIHPYTYTSPADVGYSCSASSMNAHDSYAEVMELLRSGLSPPPFPCGSAPSPSVDSGCFVTSPRSSADLPLDVIFDYVDDKLRELDEQAVTKTVDDNHRVKSEQSSSLFGPAAGECTSKTDQQNQAADNVMLQPRNPASSVARRVSVTKQISLEERRAMKASKNIAQLTREQLMTIDNNGDTLLHVALKNSEYYAEALIHRLDREQLTTCLINQRNAFTSETPLSLATLVNSVRLVRLLVERGATVNAQVYEHGSQGSGPFCAAVHLASSHGLPYLNTLAELLKAPGVDLTVVDSQGRTAMHRAIEVHGQPAHNSGTDFKNTKDSTEITRLLVLHGAEINQPDLVHHKTALQWAVERVASLGSVDLVRHLLLITSTPARSRSWTSRTGGTRYRADTVDRLLNAAYELSTENDDLRRQLIQLLTNSDNRCSYPPAASAIVVHSYN